MINMNKKIVDSLNILNEACKNIENIKSEALNMIYLFS